MATGKYLNIIPFISDIPITDISKLTEVVGIIGGKTLHFKHAYDSEEQVSTWTSEKTIDKNDDDEFKSITTLTTSPVLSGQISNGCGFKIECATFTYLPPMFIKIKYDNVWITSSTQLFYETIANDTNNDYDDSINPDGPVIEGIQDGYIIIS